MDRADIIPGEGINLSLSTMCLRNYHEANVLIKTEFQN